MCFATRETNPFLPMKIALFHLGVEKMAILEIVVGEFDLIL